MVQTEHNYYGTLIRIALFPETLIDPNYRQTTPSSIFWELSLL